MHLGKKIARSTKYRLIRKGIEIAVIAIAKHLNLPEPIIILLELCFPALAILQDSDDGDD